MPMRRNVPPDCHCFLGLQCVLFVPDKRQSTQGARAVLPPTVPRADAVFNIGRAALLVHALLTGATEDLALATQVRATRGGQRGARRRTSRSRPRCVRGRAAEAEEAAAKRCACQGPLILLPRAYPRRTACTSPRELASCPRWSPASPWVEERLRLPACSHRHQRCCYCCCRLRCLCCRPPSLRVRGAPASPVPAAPSSHSRRAAGGGPVCGGGGEGMWRRAAGSWGGQGRCSSGGIVHAHCCHPCPPAEATFTASGRQSGMTSRCGQSRRG